MHNNNNTTVNHPLSICKLLLEYEAITADHVDQELDLLPSNHCMHDIPKLIKSPSETSLLGQSSPLLSEQDSMSIAMSAYGVLTSSVSPLGYFKSAYTHQRNFVF